MTNPLYKIGDVVKIVGPHDNGKVAQITKVIINSDNSRSYYVIYETTFPEHHLQLIKRDWDCVDDDGKQIKASMKLRPRRIK